LPYIRRDNNPTSDKLLYVLGPKGDKGESGETGNTKTRYIKQGFEKAQAIEVPVLVASFYFEPGVLLAPARVFLGTDNGSNTATLELIEEDTSITRATWDSTGVLQDITQSDDISLSGGWYQVILSVSNPLSAAILSGIDWVVLEN
jgi:hypothetical protein